MPVINFLIRLTAVFKGLPVGTEMRWDGHEFYALRESDMMVINCHESELSGNFVVLDTATV